MTVKGEVTLDHENTVDTPAPLPVEPPPEAAAAIPDELVHSSSVAVPVSDNVTVSASEIPTACPKHTTCTVIAPATLTVGYTFAAQVDGVDFIVTVPEGGITEGQAFQVPYPSPPEVDLPVEAPATAATSLTPLELAAQHNIPTGQWRNGVCDCCEVVESPMFWQGLFCSPVLLGQVMQRNKFNPCGIPSASYGSTCRVICIFWAFFLLLLCIASWVNFQSSYGVAYPILITVVLSNARHHMRERYNIPVQCFGGCGGKCDDICCGFWCSLCVTIQMARHTHPPRVYPYQCRSPTGLKEGTPEIV